MIAAAGMKLSAVVDAHKREGNGLRTSSPDTLLKCAKEAGFSDVEIMPIEADMWRFYRLV